MNPSKIARKWARKRGFADFDTYIATGGSILEARASILENIRNLQRLLEWLDNADFKPPPQTEDETPDPANAHVQGADG